MAFAEKTMNKLPMCSLVPPSLEKIPSSTSSCLGQLFKEFKGKSQQSFLDVPQKAPDQETPPH